MKSYASPTRDSKDNSFANSFATSNDSTKSNLLFSDKRPYTIQLNDLQNFANTSLKSKFKKQLSTLIKSNTQQEEMYGAESKSVRDIVNATSNSENSPLQLVAYTHQWSEQKKKYQANKVGSERISDDAEWLAIVRFCRSVSDEFKSKSTVNEVIAKAAEYKRVGFKERKGSQAQHTGQEAQHLVTSSYATKVLKWPYEWINSDRNGKMLLAGRHSKNTDVSKAYKDAKYERSSYWFRPRFLGGKMATPARGMAHINEDRLTHPDYSKMVAKLCEEYYAKNNLIIGTPISEHHAFAIMDILRKWHKAEDRKSNYHTIDNKALQSPASIGWALW